MAQKAQYVLIASLLLVVFYFGSVQAAQHSLGVNIITSDGTVYTVTTENNQTVRRPYTSAGAFLSFGFNNFQSLIVASAEDVSLPTGSFIPPQDGKIICSDRGTDKGTCYLITSGKKAGFTSSNVFTSQGYSFSYASLGDVSFLVSTTNIDTATAAHLTGALVNKDGTVYLVGPVGLLGIPSWDTLVSWGYTTRDIVQANLADRNLQLVGIVALKQPGQISYPYTTVIVPTPEPITGGPAALPQGNTGIAARYPGDANIQADPDVLFADNFESYATASQLTTKWNSYYQSGNTRIATEAGNVFAGSKSLEFTLPASSSEVSNAVMKNISPTQDTLFVRVYTKFDPAYNITTGSNHNGIRISSKYPGPGTPPNGSDFYLFLLENSIFYNEADPGYSHIYVYHPEQRSQWGDLWYPDGKVLPFDATPADFGQYFAPRPNFIPQRDKWYSYELMVKANTPGLRDGRAAFWIDGNLMADFQNIRVRDISSLKIDQIQLELHAQAGGSSRPNKKWYDNLVAAKSYIGPMQ